MKQPTEMGMNRTGTNKATPGDCKRMAENTREGGPGNPALVQEAIKLRGTYLEAAEPVGTVAVPTTLKGVAATFFEKTKGRNANVLLDLLGQRLAFERTGARLYDALIGKLQQLGGPYAENALPRLRNIRGEEIRHFDWVWRTIEALGADPTVETPAADIAGVESSGLLQVVYDPRTSVPQFVHSLLVAELVDHEDWKVLAGMAEKIGDREMAERFRTALREEEQHLDFVRNLFADIVHKELS